MVIVAWRHTQTDTQTHRQTHTDAAAAPDELAVLVANHNACGADFTLAAGRCRCEKGIKREDGRGGLEAGARNNQSTNQPIHKHRQTKRQRQRETERQRQTNRQPASQTHRETHSTQQWVAPSCRMRVIGIGPNTRVTSRRNGDGYMRLRVKPPPPL